MPYVNPIVVKDVTCTCPYFSHFEVQIYRMVNDFPTEIVTVQGAGADLGGDQWKLLPVSFRHTINGRTYYIKVRCIDIFGTASDWSNTVSETAGDSAQPSKINTSDVNVEYNYGVDSTTFTATILDTYTEENNHSHYEWYVNDTPSFPSTEPIQKDKSRSLTYVVYDYPKYFFVAAVDKSGNYSIDYNTTVIASVTGLPSAPAAPHFNNVDYVISESGYSNLNNGDEYYAKTLAVASDGDGFKSMVSPIIVYNLYSNATYFDHFEIQCANDASFTTNLVVKSPNVRGSFEDWTSEPCSFDHCLKGFTYYFRVRTVDKFGQASSWAEDSNNPGVYYVSETAGDTTGPPQITSSHVTIETNGLDVFVSLSGYNRATDHDRIEWYHSTTDSWPSTTHPTAVSESGFEFSGEYGETYYIFAKAVDRSGNPSTGWNTNVGSVFIEGLSIKDITFPMNAHSVDSETAKFWHFDGSLISNSGISPVGSSPTYTIRNDGIFGKSVAVEEGTTNLLAVDFDLVFDAADMSGWHTQNDANGNMVSNGDGTATFYADSWSIMSYNADGYVGNAITERDIVTFSLYYRKTVVPANATGLNFLIRWVDDMSSTISYTGKTIALADINTTDIWERVSVKLEVPDRYETLALYAYFTGSAADDFGSFEIKQIQLEKKPFATSFVNGTRADVGTNFIHYEHGIDITKDFTVAFWVRPPVYTYHATQPDMVNRSQTDFSHSYGYAAIADFDPDTHRFDVWWRINSPYYGVQMTIQATSGTTDTLYAGTKIAEPLDDVLVVITGSSNEITLYCGQDGNVDSDTGTYYGEKKSTYLHLGGFKLSGALQYSSSSLFDELLILNYAVDEETVKTWAKNPAPFTSENQDIVKASGRIIIDGDSLRGYNSSGELTIEIGAEEGDGWFSGEIEASTITGSTLRSAESGQRVEIDSSTNTLKFYNASGNAVVTLDSDILYGYPGIGVTNGMIYVYGGYDNLFYVRNGELSITGEQIVLSSFANNYSENEDARSGYFYCGDTSGHAYGKARIGVYSYAYVHSSANTSKPISIYARAVTNGPGDAIGLYGNASSGGGSAYAGYFDNGLVYIKEDLLLDGNIIGQGAISGTSFQLNETEIIDSNGYATNELKTRSYLCFGRDAAWSVYDDTITEDARTADGSQNTQGYRMPRSGKVTAMTVQYRVTNASSDSQISFTVQRNASNQSMSITGGTSSVSDNLGYSTTSNSFTFNAGDRINVEMTLTELDVSTVTVEDIAILVEIMS